MEEALERPRYRDTRRAYFDLKRRYSDLLIERVFERAQLTSSCSTSPSSTRAGAYNVSNSSDDLTPILCISRALCSSFAQELFE